jgi:hypothetical protein
LALTFVAIPLTARAGRAEGVEAHPEVKHLGDSDGGRTRRRNQPRHYEFTGDNDLMVSMTVFLSGLLSIFSQFNVSHRWGVLAGGRPLQLLAQCCCDGPPDAHTLTSAPTPNHPTPNPPTPNPPTPQRCIEAILDEVANINPKYLAADFAQNLPNNFRAMMTALDRFGVHANVEEVVYDLCGQCGDVYFRDSAGADVCGKCEAPRAGNKRALLVRSFPAFLKRFFACNVTAAASTWHEDFGANLGNNPGVIADVAQGTAFRALVADAKAQGEYDARNPIMMLSSDGVQFFEDNYSGYFVQVRRPRTDRSWASGAAPLQS